MAIFKYIEFDMPACMQPKPPTFYVIHPGPVYSKTDGDLHYIGTHELVKLYGVDPNYAVDELRVTGGLLREEAEGRVRLVHLHPRYDGNYTLPE